MDSLLTDKELLQAIGMEWDNSHLLAIEAQNTKTLKAIGEWLDREIVRDADGIRVDCQTRYPSNQDIEALLEGNMPEEVKDEIL